MAEETPPPKYSDASEQSPPAALPTTIEQPQSQSGDFSGRYPSADLLREMLALEQQRIISADKRTEVMARAIQASDESDKRDYDLERHRIDTEHSYRERIFSFLKLIVGASFAVALGALCALLYFLVFGDNEQRLISEGVLRYAFTAVGGYGVFQVLVRLITRTLKR